jgi:pyridoxine/pyridoxamine 5'-phosphate oxidase
MALKLAFEVTGRQRSKCGEQIDERDVVVSRLMWKKLRRAFRLTGRSVTE